MTKQKILVVKTSWSYAIINSEEIGAQFYEKLFELDPALRVLFKPEMQAQTKKLMTMITFVISKLQTLEDIISEVNALAQRHVRYGVRAEYYQTVGLALLWTLEKNLGDYWNTETQQAWTEVYTLLSNAMIEAANTTMA